MKKLIALLLAVVLCVSICACGNETASGETVAPQAGGEDTVPATDDAGVDETRPAENEETTAPTQPGLELSDDLGDFTVSIDGDIYQFPCSVQTMLDDGWQSGFEDQIYSREVEAGDKTQFAMFRGEGDDRRFVFIDVYNLGTSSCTINECMILQIVKQGEEAEVILAGDFKLSNSLTADDIIAQYGEDYSLDQGAYYYRFDKGYYIFEIIDGNLIQWQIILHKSAVEG